jgi:hypothetical protein
MDTGYIWHTKWGQLVSEFLAPRVRNKIASLRLSEEWVVMESSDGTSTSKVSTDPWLLAEQFSLAIEDHLHTTVHECSHCNIMVINRLSAFYVPRQQLAIRLITSSLRKSTSMITACACHPPKSVDLPSPGKA